MKKKIIILLILTTCMCSIMRAQTDEGYISLDTISIESPKKPSELQVWG